MGPKMYVKIQYTKKIRRAKKKQIHKSSFKLLLYCFFATSSAINASNVRIRCHLQAAMLQTICIGNYVARGDLCVTGNRKE